MAYLLATLVVAALIAIHELGHLVAAKRCGIPVERFSIGFGPRLVSFRRGGTEYRLSAIPFGGYVLPATEVEEQAELPLGKAVAFALGGPAANFLAAYGCLVAVGMLQPGASALGAVAFAHEQMAAQMRLLAETLAALFTGGSELSGIVGIVAVGGSVFGSTLGGLLMFAAVLNLNLAVLNMLPLPPLDGGRILLATLGKVLGPLRRAQVVVTLAGWAFLLGLMVYATVRDLQRILA